MTPKKTANNRSGQPEEALTAPPMPKHGGQVPAASQGDLFWGEQAGGFNPAAMLASYPKQVGDWLVRSIIDKDDVNFIVHKAAEQNAISAGRTDLRQITWLYLGLKVSVGGKGRQQLLDALIGQRQANMMGGMANFVDRARNPDGNREPPK